eukprot:RCo024033
MAPASAYAVPLGAGLPITVTIRVLGAKNLPCPGNDSRRSGCCCRTRRTLRPFISARLGNQLFETRVASGGDPLFDEILTFHTRAELGQSPEGAISLQVLDKGRALYRDRPLCGFSVELRRLPSNSLQTLTLSPTGGVEGGVVLGHPSAAPSARSSVPSLQVEVMAVGWGIPPPPERPPVP